MKGKLPYCILISLVLITPFIYSDNLNNGLIIAKQIWFFGAVALLILAFISDLLFYRKNVSFSSNIIDISLLALYTYFFIRAVFTPWSIYLRFLGNGYVTSQAKVFKRQVNVDFSRKQLAIVHQIRRSQ